MSRYRDFRGVARPVGAVVIGLGVAIGACAGAGWAFELAATHAPKADGAIALGVAAVISVLVGLVLYLFGRRHASDLVTRREAILAVAMIWTAASVIGALPFVLGGGLRLDEALFESVSGLTTTGATVVTDIEGTLSRPLLLWRSMLQWLGGMGIVVLFVAVFPSIGAGGKHMFGEEVPGTSSEGLRPRIAETSRVLWQFYLFFTLLEVGVLSLLGMSLFEAVCHALTTMSTGGFSTRDASIAAFESPGIEYAIAAFMLVASVNYALFYSAIRMRSFKVFARSVEFLAYVGAIVLTTFLLTFLVLGHHGGDLALAFRKALFMVATTISSTGYGTDDFMAYPGLALWLVLTLMFLGGCAGSTAGGIKVERVVLMGKLAWAELRRSFRPALVHVVRMGRTVIQPSALTDVSVFVAIYFAALALMTGLVSAVEDVSLPASFGAALTCLSNMGPAPFHVGSDNFASYSAFSKVVFILGMLLGRLEFFALLALLVPDFWRR